jgi:hypothetical protein
MKTSQFKVYSGGAKGSDEYWVMTGIQFLCAFTIYTPTTMGKLNEAQLAEVEKAYISAYTTLGRKFIAGNTYVGKLLRRDYLQAKAGDAVFAIGNIVKPGTMNSKGYLIRCLFESVDGGTGYCVEMAREMGKPIYVYDQSKRHWFEWDYETNKFNTCETPVLTPKFAGVGTRALDESGRMAILDVFKKTNELKGML